MAQPNEGAGGQAVSDLKVAGAEGVDAAEANSYASLDDFSQHLEDFPNAAATAATPAQRSAALRRAAWIVDGIGLTSERWIGQRASASQARAWPRSNAVFDGAPYPSSQIPPQVVEASMIMAVYLIEDPDLLDKIVDHNGVVNMERVGDVERRFAVGEGSRIEVASGRERFNLVEDVLGGLLVVPEEETASDRPPKYGAVFMLSGDE